VQALGGRHDTITVFDVRNDPQIPRVSTGEIAMDRQGNMYAADPELAGIFKATPPYARALPRN
jgi:hypothetical protein